MAKGRVKGRVYISSCPDDPPDWYWANGLHDACIVDVEYFEFPFDYNKFIGNKNSCDRNLMLLKINASGAYEQDIKQIKLFNFKIITNNIELRGRKKVWWLADRLTEKDGHFNLEIDLQDLDSFPEDFKFEIQFDRVEVVR